MDTAYEEIVVMPDPEFPIKTYDDSNTNRDLSSDSHLHKEVELIYVPEGEMSFTINNKNIVVSEGNIIFINSLVLHSSFVSGPPNTRMQLLQFNPNIIYNSRLFSEYKYLTPFMDQNSLSFYLFNPKANSEYKLLTTSMCEILDEFNKKHIAYEISIKSILYKILTILYRNGILIFNTMNSVNRQKDLLHKLEKVLNYVENFYFEDITVEKACSLLNFNYSYFCRLFRAATGKSFIEYLNFVRISVAERQLLKTNKTITEIITEIGFSNISYFNRVFKSIKGMSPSSYKHHIKSSFINSSLNNLSR